FSQGIPRALDPSQFPRTSGGALDLAAIPPSTLGAVDTNMQASYNVQFNLIVEKQFGSNLINVGYVGTRGHDLVMALPHINRSLPSGTANATPRPYATRAPRVSSIGYSTTQGSSEYNAMQVNFNRRLSHGLGITAGYNLAHGEDNVTGLGTGTGGYGNLTGPD